MLKLVPSEALRKGVETLRDANVFAVARVVAAGLSVMEDDRTLTPQQRQALEAMGQLNSIKGTLSGGDLLVQKNDGMPAIIGMQQCTGMDPNQPMRRKTYVATMGVLGRDPFSACVGVFQKAAQQMSGEGFVEMAKQFVQAFDPSDIDPFEASNKDHLTRQISALARSVLMSDGRPLSDHVKDQEGKKDDGMVFRGLANLCAEAAQNFTAFMQEHSQELWQISRQYELSQSSERGR